MRAWIAVVVALAQPAVAATPSPAAQVGDAAQALTRDTRWTQVSTVPIGFDAYHAQGMVKVGDDFFVTSVEILERTRLEPGRADGFDRDQGKGQGWLFKMNARGELLARLKLGEGARYHAGGLDFDGRFLWVPVAEYRPGGASIVYRIDPKTLTAVEAFRFGDHIGAVSRDVAGHQLVGVNWGGRRFYAWPVDPSGKVRSAAAKPTPNRSHYVDYQDCHGAGARRMLCTGVAYYRPGGGRPAIALGGADLIDTKTFRPIWQAPVQAWTPSGAVMTSNAAVFEVTGDSLRGYFLPEDGQGALYTYEVRVPAG